MDAFDTADGRTLSHFYSKRWFVVRFPIVMHEGVHPWNKRSTQWISRTTLWKCRHITSVIGTGPEPAKPAGLTGLQGLQVWSAKIKNKTGFFSKPGTEPAGLDWGLMKLN